MPQVEIDDDIYDFIDGNAHGLDETVSTVLRRFLPINPPPQNVLRAASPLSEHVNAEQLKARNPLREFLKTIILKRPTDQFLKILGFVYNEAPAKFEKVLAVKGRRRRYFGRSREEIEKSGKSTHPRLIPGSGYWAMTNADTLQKREMLRRALEALEYPSEDVEAAARAIA